MLTLSAWFCNFSRAAWVCKFCTQKEQNRPGKDVSTAVSLITVPMWRRVTLVWAWHSHSQITAFADQYLEWGLKDLSTLFNALLSAKCHPTACLYYYDLNRSDYHGQHTFEGENGKRSQWNRQTPSKNGPTIEREIPSRQKFNRYKVTETRPGEVFISSVKVLL